MEKFFDNLQSQRKIADDMLNVYGMKNQETRELVQEGISSGKSDLTISEIIDQGNSTPRQVDFATYMSKVNAANGRAGAYKTQISKLQKEIIRLQAEVDYLTTCVPRIAEFNAMKQQAKTYAGKASTYDEKVKELQALAVELETFKMTYRKELEQARCTAKDALEDKIQAEENYRGLYSDYSHLKSLFDARKKASDDLLKDVCLENKFLFGCCVGLLLLLMATCIILLM